MRNHRCKDTNYRCQSNEQERVVCAYVGVVDSQPDLCPVCGELSVYTGRTKDGRLIRSCGDAHPRPDERKMGEEAE
jgi:hypothetical protein